jgi:hypothetical protein
MAFLFEDSMQPQLAKFLQGGIIQHLIIFL